MAEILRYSQLLDIIQRLSVWGQTFSMWRFMRVARFDPMCIHSRNARRFFFLMISHAKTDTLKKHALREFNLICERQDGPPNRDPTKGQASLKAPA